MKLAGWLLIAFGLVFALLALDLVNGNDNLNSPGHPVVMGVFQDNWRFLIGFLSWLAAAMLASALIFLRRLPGLSWLALLAFILLFVPYLVLPGIAPSFATVLMIVLVLVVAIPAAVFLIARSIGNAAAKRRRIPTGANDVT